MILEIIGAELAFTGSFISVSGAYFNNVWHEHLAAMELWRISNGMLAAWGIGFISGWWVDGVSITAIVGMNLFFMTTNEYGLYKYRRLKECQESC